MTEYSPSCPSGGVLSLLITVMSDLLRRDRTWWNVVEERVETTIRGTQEKRPFIHLSEGLFVPMLWVVSLERFEYYQYVSFSY